MTVLQKNPSALGQGSIHLRKGADLLSATHLEGLYRGLVSTSYDPVALTRFEHEPNGPLYRLLCSDAAEWITGQVYPVDGGYASAL